MTTFHFDILRFIQHLESIEVRCTHADLPHAFAQIIVPVPRDAQGGYLGGDALHQVIATQAPPREWFEQQEQRLAGTAPHLQTLPKELRAAVPIVGDVDPKWYEDVSVGQPEIINGQWGRRRVAVDLRHDSANLPGLKQRLKQRLADHRWRREIAGVSINGVEFQTDRESQATIAAAYARANADPTTTVRWKAATGFVHLDAQAIATVAVAVFNHVQAAFAREGVLSEQIDAATTMAALMAIDIDQSWD